ncbi:tripartite tricarboxylate transporter TctB family protein [Terrarubrum flagellatum]|uniref:tripartite tricarboxylate transporter TctB family protein n=1 Tax=Terrirubrum flagellatum TaxID=2895980 RepID=UPI00314504CC
MTKDMWGGVALLIIAAAYYIGIGQIAESTLSDDVGATGLPRMLALSLAVVALALIARSLIAARAATVTAAGAANDDEEEETATLPRAIGLLLFGAAYILILPYAGYLVSIALLIAGVCAYEGAARDWRLPVIAIAGAALYWAIFVKLLGVHQPAGLVFSGLLS